MRVRNILLGVGLISLLGAQSAWAQEIVVTIGDKDNNATGLQPEIDEWFNKADCDGDIEITFEVDVINVDNTDDLFLFVGSSCNTSVGSCTELDTIERNTSAAITDAPFLVNLKEIFTAQTDCIENTDSQDEINIWAGVLENPDEDSENNIWSEPRKLTLDLHEPPAATDVKAQFGEESIAVEWDADGDDLVHPLDGVDETETDTDTDSDSETDGSSSSETEILVDGQFYVIYESCGVAVGDGGSGGDTDTVPDLPFETDTDTDGGSDSGDQVVDCKALCADVGFEAGDTDFSEFPFEEVGSSSRSATIKGLTNGTAYKLAVVSFDAFINPSEISEWDCAIPGETVNFFEAYFEGGGKGAGHYCFVATAAFGSYDHPTVRVLRKFRDGFLSGVMGGEQLIEFYYAVGPKLAGLLDGRPRLASSTRGALSSFAPVAARLTKMGPAPFNFSLLLLCCGSVVGIFVLRRRRRG